jgi:molybdenum cofactor cytidylyltransferase
MISCIVLAAGLSERFGSPKALVTIQGLTAIELLQHKLMSTCCDEIIIVLGAFSQQLLPYVLNHKRIRVVYNKDYKFGQTSSFQAGLKSISTSTERALLLPVDCPFIQHSTINKVCQDPLTLSSDILIPTYQYRRGHPPVFSKHAIEYILNMPINHGINTLFTNPSLTFKTLEIDDPGIIQTFNTPDELRKLLT